MRVAPTARPDPTGPGRGRGARRARRALARAVGKARARAYGRERARRRVATGQWDPHPGWRNRVDDDLVVLTDQVAALRRIEELVDAELWRADKRTRWIRMLRRLMCSMDWTTGLVCGVTLAQLAEVGDCSPRTVSRLIAWAQDVDLLVVVEVGATAAFLGTDRNRAPAYVLVAPPTPPAQKPRYSDDDHHHHTVQPTQVASSAQLNGPVEENGNLPHSYVGSKPLSNSKRLDQHPTPHTKWPAWRIPSTPTERSAAVTALLARIGLGHDRVPFWRARALLYQWWAEGACLAGLLWAVDHYPDGTARGDALRGATDPLRVLGHRLRPWVGQLHQLPPGLVGHHGDYQTEQAARVAQRIAAAERNHAQHITQRSQPSSTAAARQAARAALEAVLAGRTRRHTGCR
jgi:hypothetical protein